MVSFFLNEQECHLALGRPSGIFAQQSKIKVAKSLLQSTGITPSQLPALTRCAIKVGDLRAASSQKVIPKA